MVKIPLIYNPENYFSFRSFGTLGSIVRINPLRNFSPVLAIIRYIPIWSPQISETVSKPAIETELVPPSGLWLNALIIAVASSDKVTPILPARDNIMDFNYEGTIRTIPSIIKDIIEPTMKPRPSFLLFLAVKIPNIDANTDRT